MSEIWLNSLLLLVGTSIGSLVAVFFKKVPVSVNLSLSFAGGVMMVASFTSLILPALQKGGFLQASLGVVIGFLLIGLIEHLFPHEHVIKGEEGIIKSEKIKKLFLLFASVVIHFFGKGHCYCNSYTHSGYT